MTNTSKMETRLTVLKTYKIHVNGQFPRTESGRYYTIKNAEGKPLANACLCSRKDVRDAISAARAAFGGWSGKTAFNRSQVLYRIAEILEGRKAQFAEELVAQGAYPDAANAEVSASIDRLVYYAGWCDKYQQIASAVNPVASPHFNFSSPEPTGVVCAVAPPGPPLLGLISHIVPIIAGGNTCVVLASETKPLSAVTFGEVLATSDVPPGVVNILTGKPAELCPWMADHMDVNAITFDGLDTNLSKDIEIRAAKNLKRIVARGRPGFSDGPAQSPYPILDFQEIKTTWHPVENVGGGKAGY